MERTTQGAVARPAVASAVTTIGLVGLVVAAARLARTRVGALLGPTPPSVDEVVVLGAAVLSLALSLWLLLALAVSAAAHLPGLPGRVSGALARRIAPVAVRRLAAIAVGVGVVGSGVATTASPATAAPAPVLAAAVDDDVPSPAFAPTVTRAPSSSASTPTAPTAGTAVVPTLSEVAVRNERPGWVPSASSVRRPADARLVTGPARESVGGEVVVHRGDCLWDIVAAHLGPSATDDDIVREWPRWYAANRDVIGDDPDRITPVSFLYTSHAAAE
ncbi:LysM peptidoglycan-binding domain-containing protein [Janibacter massiliensis]|uniref:LysM peptidoglycan-binding domain-containing protein n=1 Tax=Janibacter massiliensis TaxID=2058291 RepID=UPI000D10ECBD|nr:hypothetical protein [Janibacter massiliensis]